MNRSTRRAADRRGKRRTKPPVAHLKAHLPGDHACAARQTFLAKAILGQAPASPAPCSSKLHPNWDWSK